MSEAPERRELPRRAFLKLATAAAAAAAVPATALAQAPATPPATPPAAPAATPPAAPAVPEHSGSEARLLTEVLRERYPDRFTETEWTSIVGDFDGDIGAGKRLRAVKLANADEPDFTFRP
jgi:hypothetical protein